LQRCTVPASATETSVSLSEERRWRATELRSAESSVGFVGGRELRSDSGGARRACGGVQSESSDGERAVGESSDGERADGGAIGEAVESSDGVLVDS